MQEESIKLIKIALVLLRHNFGVPALAARAHSEAASQSNDQRQQQ